MPTQTIAQIQAALNQNQLEQALQLSQKAIVQHPTKAVFYFYLAFILSQQNDYEKAYTYQQQGTTLEPDNAVYHFNAAVYASQAQHKDLELRAMLHYQRALRLEPNHHDALWNYGEHLRLNGHIQMAIDCFERLLKLNKPYPKIYNRLAASYECLNQNDKVDSVYAHLLQDTTDVIGAWGYATEQLRRENFETGWAYYNKRFDCSWLNNAYHYPFDLPWWDGILQPNMTLLIHGEQGLGDEMMFTSTFNELIHEAQAVHAKIIIGCKAPLARLFRNSFTDVQDVLIHTYDKPMSIDGLSIDAHLPMGNLLSRYRKSHADFAAHQQPYLKADSNRAEYYNQRIAELGRQALDGKRRFRVGLMWSTVANETVSRFVKSANTRSINAELLAPLAKWIEDVEFISLQNHECGHQAALLPELHIIDFSLDQSDFYDTAALISNLDLVVTIDTSIFHLAAAMGVETWVTLKNRPEWRFGQDDRNQSYWYDNTRYFRQIHNERWQEVIAHLSTALGERLEQFKHRHETVLAQGEAF